MCFTNVRSTYRYALRRRRVTPVVTGQSDAFDPISSADYCRIGIDMFYYLYTNKLVLSKYIHFY